MSDYRPHYKWYLSDLEKVEKNGLKVFSCFACGGGSTMGYKLAGFDVIGANDIDPEMAWHYKTNHNPKHYYLEDIRKFRQRDDLPKELYELDILDGSPPCSSFSMAGSREKGWGKKKQFREGQAEQVLDDLFFDFIELARKLQPKVVIAENVKGMLQGNAKGYVKQIIGLFNVAGYDVQLFLLNAATMGVPQKRERVFFICQRKDLSLPQIKLSFNSKPVSIREAFEGLETSDAKKLTPEMTRRWLEMRQGSGAGEIGKFNQFKKLSLFEPSFTMTANSAMLSHPKEPRNLSCQEKCVIGSYPFDYKFRSDAGYLIGMSVPPLMTYGVANQVYLQWFKRDNHS
jgi:DNA (cytosine-5)-methyltransferase 1